MMAATSVAGPTTTNSTTTTTGSGPVSPVVTTEEPENGVVGVAAVIPSSSQEEDSSVQSSSLAPPKRRRSNRDTNRIRISADRTGQLQFQRMEQLFFQEIDNDDNNGARRTRRRRQCKKSTIPILPPLRLGNFTLQPVFQSPSIYTIDNFLTPNDLEFLHGTIECKQFQRSFVDQNNDDTMLDDNHRTSTFVSFAKQENAKVAAIERRAAQLMGCYTNDNIEPLQLVRYMPGQFFGVHHDMGDYNEETGEVALPPKSVLVKRRLVTIFCYLNDLPANAGGCTGFPHCNDLKVQPRAGRAVVFCNVKSDGLPDPRTIHAGEAVLDTINTSNKKMGTKKKQQQDKLQPPIKYGLNIWICED
ncbi:Prolyl 4-hydroxylase [Seminavis robusta]|uniref:Prolyl 4-hydroxylase n=1 Tax=Seminavis robusta TaxID=568900 RepID=A0A9N8DBM9_9STRA|nr:Prolyl 4-hydroxylase [Seminavis robusta]|eukprot:Sro25_g017040.1 Prolyl 4-hydroxylase (359) ;mRNA; f:99503-100707